MLRIRNMDDEFIPMYEVLGITKFMIFLSQRLTDREYYQIRELHIEYLDINLEYHLKNEAWGGVIDPSIGANDPRSN